MPRLVPANWMPECHMERIITHWTAGQYHANGVDREHYHILIESDGRLVRGEYAIDDNVTTRGGDYAAHTRGLNTGSVGVAMCCMAGAMQRPFQPGKFPMTKEQYEALTVVAADLCECYRLRVSRRTVLGHGEVESVLGMPQHDKWDPMVLPWDPEVASQAVGDAFRERVQAVLQTAEGPASLPPVVVLLNGRVISEEGITKGGASWCPLQPLADALGWTTVRTTPRSSIVRTPSRDFPLESTIRGDRVYVKIRDLCGQLGWDVPVWDPKGRTVTIRAT